MILLGLVSAAGISILSDDSQGKQEPQEEEKKEFFLKQAIKCDKSMDFKTVEVTYCILEVPAGV